MDPRSDPDRLLEQIRAEEQAAGRGRLKLFFGASPGVGKTYAMLEAARQRSKQGWDVVIGLVETHGRAETEALLDGLEILPRKNVTYKSVTLGEFDLDAALTRHPRLLIVDELAHSNAEGLRHAKRWQDIDELLNAGIDVYTTINVQHWESLNDVVTQITGVAVRETVPDTFLQRTHELELVDLAPEDLLQRIKDGKVYKSETAGRAAENFFKPGNLIALRELALRHAAERVDAQMDAFRKKYSIDDVWAAGERLLVGVSASPLSPRLIRATSRLASRLRAPWIALHVETAAFMRLPQHERSRAFSHLQMAEKLGAEIETVTGDNVTDELITYARSRNVTQIILGQPASPRWKERLFGSIVSELARRCGNIGLHVISGADAAINAPSIAVAETKTPWPGITAAVVLVAALTLLCWPLAQKLDRANLIMLYLIGVVSIAYKFGRRSAFVASLLSVLSFDFFFVPPSLTFAVTDTQYVLTFVVMLGVGLFISTIMGQLRQQTNAQRERAERMRTLYKLSRALSETPDTRQMLELARLKLEAYYHWPVLLLTSAPNHELNISAGDAGTFGWNENEMAVARWVYDHSETAGAGSDTLAGALGLYVPLKGLRRTMGVLAIKPTTPKTLLEPDSAQLLETFASEIGGALESTQMSEAIGRAEIKSDHDAIAKAGHQRGIGLAGAIGDRILILEEETSKEDVLRALVGKLSLTNNPSALRAILEREKAGSTLIGESAMIPHARLDGIQTIQAAIAITRKNQIRIWLLFVSPQSDPAVHLQFLASAAAFFRDKNNVDTLGRATNLDDIQTCLS